MHCATSHISSKVDYSTVRFARLLNVLVDSFNQTISIVAHMLDKVKHFALFRQKSPIARAPVFYNLAKMRSLSVMSSDLIGVYGE